MREEQGWKRISAGHLSFPHTTGHNYLDFRHPQHTWVRVFGGFLNACFETSEERVFRAFQGNLEEIQATK